MPANYHLIAGMARSYKNHLCAISSRATSTSSGQAWPGSLGIYIKRRIEVYFCYNTTMKQKPLIETNPYLRDPAKLRKLLVTNVSTSTAVETGASVDSISRMLEKSEKPAPFKTTQRSSR